MSEYLSANELADLIGCRANQRAIMCRWLDERRWKYVESKGGMPKVLRAYRDKKLGLGHEETKYESGPNLGAFVGRGQRGASAI